MILELYLSFLVVAVILVLIGLFRPEESALALIGFMFVFVLGLVVLGGNLQYDTGAFSTTRMVTTAGVTTYNQTITLSRTAYTESYTHNFGLYLAMAGFLGFAIVLYEIKKTSWGNG